MPDNPNSMVNVHTSIPTTLAQTVESYGKCSKTLFAKAGVDVYKDLGPDKRLDGAVSDELWRLATQATGDDAIGLIYTQYIQLSSFHGLGFSWAASDSLYDAFARFARFFPVISTAGEIDIRDKDDEVHAALVLPVPYGIANDSGVDSSLALLLHLCRLVRGKQFRPKLVEYQRPKPKSVKTFRSFFNCPINFDAPENKIVLSANDMHELLPGANSELTFANDRVLLNYLRKQGPQNIISEISMLVVSALPSGAPSQQQIADQLHISRKTLQRRLKNEGTTLTRIIDDIRIQHSARYLVQDWRSISEICYLLGFTEPSNFTRWFKKINGVSPQAFRDIKLNKK